MSTTTVATATSSSPYACRSVSSFERLDFLGEGAYGTVYRARDKESNEIVALKKVKLVLRNGFPITAIREIKILKAVSHDNIVKLQEVVVGRKRDSIFLVFEYCEHDFADLMDRMPRVWSESEIKCLMLQLLQGVRHMHRNFLLHRDLKLSNLFMTHDGVLKLGDFGLARRFGNPLGAYTPTVITLWYRAPELLLGCEKYHTAVDMWAVGCIFGELLLHRPLLPGSTEMDQLERIFRLLGNPTPKIAPTRLWSLYDERTRKLPVFRYNSLKDKFPSLSAQGLDLIQGLLTYDPSKRLTATQAIEHPYFRESPLPKARQLLPTFPSQSTHKKQKIK